MNVAALQERATFRMDPGLQGAKDAAMLAYLMSTSDQTTKICTANSLCSYWSESDQYDAERSEALVIREFLNAEEVRECCNAAEIAAAACESRKGIGYDEMNHPGHVKLYLHRDGYIQRDSPVLCDKLMHGMISQPGNWGDHLAALNVRCIEFHTYSVGGSLLTPGHRDNGSVLTMAVLLSDAVEVEGGQFVTWKEGEQVSHEMEQGDAILFHSEKCHNVSTVTSGTRHSLVVELWVPPTNTTGRFE